jgi:hypothetical protein
METPQMKLRAALPYVALAAVFALGTVGLVFLARLVPAEYILEIEP